MSSRKKPSSPRTKKKPPVKNTFDLVQFKKMIGKGLILPYKNIAKFDEKIKDKLLSKSVRMLYMTGFVSSGILYIFDGIDRLLAIAAISYAEIKKNELDFDIIIYQYPKLSSEEIASLV